MLLIASAEWDNDEEAPAPANSGKCRLSVDGTALPRGVSFGESTDTHTIEEGGSISMNWITGSLSAGAHTFAFECQEEEGSVYVGEAMLSAVLLDSASVQAQLPI